MPQFNRATPSPRYRELTALYERMHTEGETRLGIPPEQTFPGISLLPHVARIKRLIDETGARTILDYGAGKGMQYRPQKILVGGEHVADGVSEYWDVDEVRCYDPGFPAHRALPTEKFDGVISTDVLEHCPEEDLGWILDEILGFATKFVFLNVACFPARKSLPNGENAHVTLRAPAWWSQRLRHAARGRPQVRWVLHAVESSASGVVETVVRGVGDEERNG